MGDDISEINMFEKCKRLTDYLIEADVTFPTNKSLNMENNYIKV